MDSGSGSTRPSHFLIAAVGERPAFQRAVASAFGDLVDGSERFLTTSALPYERSDRPEPYRLTRDRSRRFLDRAFPHAVISVCSAEPHAEAGALLRAAAGPDATHPAALARVLVDAVAADVSAEPLDGARTDELDSLRAALPAHVGYEPSPDTVHVYDDAPAPRARIAEPHNRRRPPGSAWAPAADLICAFTDVIRLRHSGGALRSSARTAPPVLAGGPRTTPLPTQAPGAWQRADASPPTPHDTRRPQ